MNDRRTSLSHHVNEQHKKDLNLMTWKWPLCSSRKSCCLSHLPPLGWRFFAPHSVCHLPWATRSSRKNRKPRLQKERGHDGVKMFHCDASTVLREGAQKPGRVAVWVWPCLSALHTTGRSYPCVLGGKYNCICYYMSSFHQRYAFFELVRSFPFRSLVWC